MNSALILRPKENPPVRILEVDGPKRRYLQRGEGSYYLQTNNHPILFINVLNNCDELDARLKDWDEPNWEIYQMNDGTMEVHACRPTYEETCEGDLHGALGSVIRLSYINRNTMSDALWLARKLAKCDPIIGINIPENICSSFHEVQTNIPIAISPCLATIS